MSENPSPAANPFAGHRKASARGLDRRTARTRAALLKAFNELIIAEGWGGFTAADVAARADVGRSTLYEHFQGKEDLLGQAMGPMLAVLASAGGPGDEGGRLEWVVAHFWDARRLARALLTGGAQPVVARSLAAHLETRLGPTPKDTALKGAAAPGLPRPLAASLIARAQLGLLEDWLTGRHHAAAAALAEALRATTRALTAALVS